MPLIDPTPPSRRRIPPSPFMPDNGASPVTRGLTCGVCRMLAGMGYGTLTEFRLPNGRRVDVIGLGTRGDFAIVEIKSTVEDFRGDRKWREYLPFCERFYFAVPEGFPHDLLPPDHGFMVADAYDALILRPSEEQTINPARRRALTLRFARAAAQRLAHLGNPREGG